MSLLPEIFLQRVRDSADRDAFGQRGPGGWTWASWATNGCASEAIALTIRSRSFGGTTRRNDGNANTVDS